jgi:hypothetical protein
MNENQLQSARHKTVRTFLRIAGPLVAAVGLVLTIIALASFFSSFGTFEPPRYFWCAFLGLPLMFVGGVFCMYGYLGVYYRYIAGEAAPVMKDAANYMGEGVQPGVKAVAKAITEGIIEAQHERPAER